MWGKIFPRSKHTWGTQKNYGPPPEYMCFTRPCARTCAPATTVAAGRLGRRPRQAWTIVFSESPSQTSLEMYHQRRHRAISGRGANLGARARSEAIWVLLARKKSQMKCFLPEPRLPLEPCTVANGLARHQCWGDASSGCWCHGPIDGVAALSAGNGPIW